LPAEIQALIPATANANFSKNTGDPNYVYQYSPGISRFTEMGSPSKGLGRKPLSIPLPLFRTPRPAARA
jgi:hypothetical protein